MSQYLVEYNLTTKDWGKVLISRPLPRDEDPWGMLAPLKGTPWEALIPVVDGEVMSHALHGHATPLMRVIGPPPKALLRMLPDPYRRCSRYNNCALYHKDHCQPGPKLPECYDPPEIPEPAVDQARQVALAWRSGRYVIVISGVEFSL